MEDLLALLARSATTPKRTSPSSLSNFGQKWHKDLVAKYAPDIHKDKVMRVLHHLFLPSHIALALQHRPRQWGFKLGHRTAICIDVVYIFRLRC
jgi:hypothetical protein